MQHEDRPWDVLSSTMRATAKEVLGETCGEARRKEENWWWNAEA